MDADEALEFVDHLVYAKTGKHLNDSERVVFLGSWEGKTYKEIDPWRAENFENSVAYRLWKKLTETLGEKVNKKGLQGAVKRASKQQKRISIIYREQKNRYSISTDD